MKRLAMVACVGFLGFLSACMSVKAYVDPGLQKIRYVDLRQPQERFSIGVLVEFQRDGQEFPSVNESARGTVLRVLKASQLFSSVHRGVATSERKLEIIINNAGGETKGSAVVTGLIFGGVGTGTVDHYIITANYRSPGNQAIVLEYQHVIHATVGLKSGPKGLEPMTISAAFDKVVEEVVLLLLYDLQEKGVL